MKHHIDSSRPIGSPFAIHVLCAACLAVLLNGATVEALASVMYLAGAETGTLESAHGTDTSGIDDRWFEERTTQPVESSRPDSPIDVAIALTGSRHETAADAGRTSLWIGQDTAQSTINQFPQELAAYGSSHALDGSSDQRSRSPVVPLAPSLPSWILFSTALVGMLGAVRRGDLLIKKDQNADEVQPHRPCATGSVVLLSRDVAFSRNLEGHLHRAGYAVRVASAASEILAIHDPASILLVLVDCRNQDWDILRTDSSLRHVPLMAVVPVGCLYAEDRCIWDLERGMDGVHDLQDGHGLLVAKVDAYLRRMGCDKARRGIYHVGAVELDGDAHEVRIAGRQVKLSAKPFAILRALMREPSKVFSRSELVNLVWGPDFAVGQHALNVHVHALRRRLDREPNRLCELVTIKRVGFKLKPVSSIGSIRTSRPRPMSNSISDSHVRSKRTPRATWRNDAVTETHLRVGSAPEFTGRYGHAGMRMRQAGASHDGHAIQDMAGNLEAEGHKGITMRVLSILSLAVILFSAEAARGSDLPSRDGELLPLLNLNCTNKAHEQQFQSALESTSSGSLKRAEVLVLYVQCLLHAKQRASEAVPLLKEAEQILPSNAGVHRHLGAAYFRLGMDQEAIEAYERSLDLAPDAHTYAQLGFAKMRAVSGPFALSDPGMFNQTMARAEEHVQRAISLSPDNPLFHSHLGTCPIGRGKREEGISELHRAIDLIPPFKEWPSAADRAFALADLSLSWTSLLAIRQENRGRTSYESGCRAGAKRAIS